MRVVVQSLAWADWGYLDGLLRVCGLASQSPEILALMTGVKWPLEDAPLVAELHQQGRLLMPTRLPDAGKLGLVTSVGSAADPEA